MNCQKGIQAWHAITVGSILLLASGFFDIVDGQVARATKNVTKTGGFLDSVFDRVAEVAINTCRWACKPIPCISCCNIFTFGKLCKITC